MDPVTGSLIVGGMMTGGSLLANQQNAQNARAQMDFQREMSNTSHQREVQDLRAAGLNPILSALGNGASVPNGAMPEVNNIAEGISKGADTAIALRQQNKDLQQKDAQIDTTRAQAGNLHQDTNNKIAQSGLISAQAISTAKDVQAKEMQNKILKETLAAQIKKAKAEGDYSEVNQIMGIINSGASSAGQLINPLKWFTPGKKK